MSEVTVKVKADKQMIAEQSLKGIMSAVTDALLTIEEQFEMHYGCTQIEVEISDGRRIELIIKKAELSAKPKEAVMVAKKKVTKKVAKKAVKKKAVAKKPAKKVAKKVSKKIVAPAAASELH